ncbi:MAG: tetratricopeptide repeat protein [Acidobacteriota bacterium]
MKKVLFTSSLLLLAGLSLGAAKEKTVVLPPEKLAEVQTIVRKADSLLARKFYEDAVVEYSKALEINPRDYVVHNKLGIAYHQLQAIPLAKKQYERAKKLNAQYSEAWNNLGTIHYGMKKYKKAVKNYKKAIQLQPLSATAYHNMGAAYFGMKKHELGFQAYLEAYRLDPRILERTSNYGTIIRTAEINQGVQNFYLAKLFAMNGQMDKALAYLLKALENGFSDYEKITKEPTFELLVKDERLVRMMADKGPQP